MTCFASPGGRSRTSSGSSITAGRRHVFKDKSTLDLPLGNRGDQHAALVAAFGEDEWSPWVDTYSETWDVIRRTALDQIFAGRPAVDKRVRKVLRPRHSLMALAEREFADERLAKLVLDPVRLAGDERRVTPAFVAVSHYVERNFGRWRFTGGLPALAEALEARLAERGVTVELGESGPGTRTRRQRRDRCGDGPTDHSGRRRRVVRPDLARNSRAPADHADDSGHSHVRHALGRCPADAR